MLVFPYFSYCNIVWGSNFQTYIQNLFTLQKRAISLICNLPQYSSSKANFREPNLLTLENINNIKFSCSCFVTTIIYFPNLLPWWSFLASKMTWAWQLQSKLHATWLLWQYMRNRYRWMNVFKFIYLNNEYVNGMMQLHWTQLNSILRTVQITRITLHCVKHIANSTVHLTPTFIATR